MSLFVIACYRGGLVLTIALTFVAVISRQYEGVLHWRLCGVSVSLQMASNISDLLLKDQLSYQESCKPFSATSPWLKAVILSSYWKELRTIPCQCFERTTSITEHWNLRWEGQKIPSLSWFVKLQSECAVSHAHNMVYLKQVLHCVGRYHLANDALARHHCNVFPFKWTECSLVISVAKFLSFLSLFYLGQAVHCISNWFNSQSWQCFVFFWGCCSSGTLKLAWVQGHVETTHDALCEITVWKDGKRSRGKLSLTM